MATSLTAQIEHVRARPEDFAAWTTLITAAEQLQEIKQIREVFDAFLAEYPLCYVYWNRYAEYELNHTGAQACVAVYERAVSPDGIPYSVEIWEYYCTYATTKSTTLGAAEKAALYERALQHVGLDWTAAKLWEPYLQFQVENDAANALGIYERALAVPMLRLPEMYANFERFAGTRPESELSSVSFAEGATEAEKRAQYLAHYRLVFEASQAAVEQRTPWENEVQKRTYFHNAPMSDSDLQVWHSYLSFEENAADPARIVQLFERCLIACCNYPEMWSRYTAYWEKMGKPEEARAVYQRGVSKHLKRQPAFHLEFALFEESTSQAEHAEQLFAALLQSTPSHLQAVVAFANFYRRQGKPEQGKPLFTQALLALRDHPKPVVFLTVAYARYCAQACEDVAAGRQVFVEGRLKLPTEQTLEKALVQYERRFGDAQSVVEAYRVAVENESLSIAERSALWMEYVEYMETEGASNGKAFWEASREAQRNLHQLACGGATKRRMNEGGEPAAKVSRAAGVANPSAGYGRY